MIDPLVDANRTPWPDGTRAGWGRAGRLVRTIGHLRPSQVAYRFRLRALRLIDPWMPDRGVRTAVSRGEATPGWPVGFRALEARLDHGDAKEIASGRFSMLGEVRDIGDPADWHQVDAPHLWRFCLHYLEWAWALAAVDDNDWARASFAGLWRSWTTHVNLRNRDAWAPYVVSLRAWVLCDVFDVLVAGSDVEPEVVAALQQHASFLRRHLELDVGGNHLVKNLKAIVALGVFLGDPELVALGRRHLVRQLSVQVLADGGHYERSPTYHCQVLGDLIDVENVLAAARQPPIPGLSTAIERMRRWLGAIVGPDGEVPLLNDAVAVGTERLASLSPDRSAFRRLTVLGPSGYVVVCPDRRAYLVLDVGDACPDDLPAHAHADCLSFELWVDGRPVIVDTGTSTYEPGLRRAYERSTAAHNTVEVDGTNQTEVWGTFRAGRRARGTLLTAEDDGTVVTVVASHNGYRHLPGSPIHHRRWIARPGGLQIDDVIEGSGQHCVTSSLYVDDPARSGVTLAGRGATGHTSPCDVARGFGQLRPAVRHRLTREDVVLPCELWWFVTW
jgi:uncharacterized heparinase superfamily protein